MVRFAAEMMLEPAVVGDSAALTNWLLRQIAYLDDWGAWEWNLPWASFGWLVFFASIRFVFHERGGVNWYSLLHAIITGIGGVVCSYLSFVSAEHMTGTPEPLGMVLCHGPLTSLHRVLPTAAVGYSVLDLIDGMRLGADFMSHGAVMFLFSAYVMVVNKNEVLAVMLTLEVSTIFLNFLRCKYFSDRWAMANMFCFVLSFFLSRIVFAPFSVYQHSYLLYTVGRANKESKACLPTGFDHVIFITGMFFNLLKFFWFYKILKKVERKLKGEHVQANNHLNAKDKKEQD